MWSWKLLALSSISLFSLLETSLSSTESDSKEKYPQCPYHMHPMFDSYRKARKKQPRHCACPSSYLCEGCEKGCKSSLGRLLSNRCVFGFKPDCGSQCRCAPLQEEQDSILGVMIDRRKSPLCPVNESVTRWIEANRYKGNYTFVFVVSNGHTGTTFLGQPSTWYQEFGNKSKLLNQIKICHEVEPNVSYMKEIPFHHDFCDRALEYVVKEKLPRMKSDLRHTRKTIFFDSGHQIILGLVPALIQVLGDKVKFVRLRRNKFDVAHSFWAEKGYGPCSSRCLFCSCPLDPMTRLKVPGSIWSSMSSFQKYLWFVDEVEAQWQSTLESFPNINYIETNWNARITSAMFTDIARFAGATDIEPLPHVELSAVGHHDHHIKDNHTNMTTFFLNEEKIYLEKMNLKSCTMYHCLKQL